jgi:DNA-binding transcriptional LysR family regulator
MEMHQVRYFLAVTRTLNFTRAAEECHVAQPSLTRAVRQLEGELGGDLFRRERPAAQLTELGQRMLPLLKQCYESAQSARTVAASIKTGDVGSLRLALSHTIDLNMVMPHIQELTKHFRGLELKLYRGTASEIIEYLKRGDAELGIAATTSEEWDRLDAWPLFEEQFRLVIHSSNKLAAHDKLALDDLRQEQLLTRNYCEQAGVLTELLQARNFDLAKVHELSTERDLLTLLDANIGVAFMPGSVVTSPDVKRVQVEGIDLQRTIYLYGVAGRQRTPAAVAAMKMLRAFDWKKVSI